MIYPNKNKAFTLVELIVVIVILAILATIAFLSFNSYSSSARNSDRLADMRNISKALELTMTNAGKYPTPTGGTNVMFSGSTIWTQGTFGQSVQRVSNSISKVPVDPLFNVEYTYSVLNTGREYQLSGLSEGSPLANNDMNPFGGVIDTYADSTTYQAMTIGTYNGMTARVFTGGIYYFLAIPSIVAVTPPSTLIDGTGIYLAVNGQGNISDDYLNSTTLTLTGGGTFQVKVIMTGSTLNFDANQTVQLIKGLQSAYSGSIVSGGASYQNLLSINSSDNQSLYDFGTNILPTQLGATINSSGSITTYNLSSTSIQAGNTTTIIDNCSIHPTSYTSSNTSIATVSGNVITGVSSGTANITPIGGNCFNSSSKVLTVTPSPIVAWKNIAGTNCSNDDLVFSSGGVTYRWAGCNSVLGTGMEWGDAGSVASCYSYNSTSTPANCPIGDSSMASTSKEKSWTVASGISGTVDNIWGKLYTWSQATSAGNACPTGWHLPSDSEYNTVETYLNGGTYCGNGSFGSRCNGLGWSGNASKTASNNMIKALQIPLAGNRNNSWYFYSRGYNANLWSSTPSDASNAHYVQFTYSDAYAYLYQSDKLNGFSVRCVSTY